MLTYFLRNHFYENHLLQKSPKFKIEMILTILMFNYIMIIKYENCFKNILNCQINFKFKASVFTLKTFPLYSAKKQISSSNDNSFSRYQISPYAFGQKTHTQVVYLPSQPS